MSVRDIVDQFTNRDFTLIVVDSGYYAELYNGSASEVYDDPVGLYPVVAIEPPERAKEVVLFVDVDEYLDIDSYELFAEDQ
jgi:hypothetical protein